MKAKRTQQVNVHITPEDEQLLNSVAFSLSSAQRLMSRSDVARQALLLGLQHLAVSNARKPEAS